MRRSTRLVRSLLVLAALAAARPVHAGDPGVRSELFNGVPRITLEGNYAGARYTVRRADKAGQAFVVIGEQSSLCTGDCAVVDPSALLGATYLYRFDVTGSDGMPHTYGPYAVAIGGRAVEGLGASPSPNPLRDRGTLRVTAALPAGQRAGNPASAMGLPGDVTIVDTGGRVIRTLWRGTLDRLTFDVPFVARDEQGRAIPPGLYFVVVRAGEHRSISRVAVVR